MLSTLRLKGIGVIDDTTLELGPGFTALTGETGAGKTMVVTGLGLLLGARLDSNKVRPGGGVEGRVVIPDSSPLCRRLDELGAERDADELLLARRTTADGRSRVSVGGASVPVAVLAELGEQLVTVHGQSDQIRLRSRTTQREALDRYCGKSFAAKLKQFKSRFAAHSAHRSELAELRQAGADRLIRAQLLSAALEDIEQVTPEPGEDELLKAEESKLANGADLVIAAQRANVALTGDEMEDTAAVNLLNQAQQDLAAMQETDQELAQHAASLESLIIQLTDLSAELSSYSFAIDTDPGRLEQVQSRRAELTAMVKKHSTLSGGAASVDELLEWSAEAAKELLTLEGSDARIAELESQIESEAAELDRLADELTKLRSKGARSLEKSVTAELRELSMPGAELKVKIGVAETLRESGRDSIELQLIPHPGSPASPLGSGASGGELSRVMLALEVALAERAESASGQLPTFVFDEVDSGVGGKAAVQIGQRLAKLSKHAQVLVVTHLPQVAAYADRHVLVEKSIAQEQGAAAKKTPLTISRVRTVAQADREKELARMLAGSATSQTAIAHARELIDQADA